MNIQRKCLPLEEWPNADRTAWQKAVAAPDPFLETGKAAHWTEKTRKTVIKGYGRWLSFAKTNNWLGTDDTPGRRVSLERVRAYFQMLQDEVAPITAAGRIRDLGEALRVMDSGSDTIWIRNLARKLAARAKPSRNKAAKMVHIRTLFDLGAALMTEAETTKISRPAWRAARYRMGLMIAIACTCPIRRANFTTLKFAETFLHRTGGYCVSLGPAETKGHRPYEANLPPELTPAIDRYMETYRPQLLGERASDHLWISWEGHDLTEAGFYGELCKVTQRRLNVSITPHLIRDIVTTSVALDDPAHFRMVMPILQHNSERTTIASYNQAKQAEAVTRLQATVTKLRRTRSASSRQ